MYKEEKMFGTYKENDVKILLTDISGKVKPFDTEEREQRIQTGVHYSEMLPIEHEPSPTYMEIYQYALHRHSKMTARAVAVVAEQIWREKGAKVVLVSLARAGTSIGVLIKRYIASPHHVEVPHYTISILRGRGIDQNAMDYILTRHMPEDIQFVDGWTGKGAIQNELNQAMKQYKNVDAGLAVLSDPAHIAKKYGTQEDFLIASSCLNATVSGLLSRTFYRKDMIGEKQFHGAIFYRNLLKQDVTYEFIHAVERYFATVETDNMPMRATSKTAKQEVEKICADFDIHDINLVKPSIGETTRVLLRRVPWKILVHRLDDETHLEQIYQLAKEKGVPMIEYPLENYRACGLIQKIADN